MDGAEAGKSNDARGGGTLLELIPAVGPGIEIENKCTSEVLNEIQHGDNESNNRDTIRQEVTQFTTREGELNCSKLTQPKPNC